MKKITLSPAVATILLLLAAMIWGFAFSAQQQATAYLGSFTITCVRSVIAVVAISLAVMGFDRVRGNGRHLFSVRNGRFRIDLTRTELVGGIFCGITLAMATMLQQFGLAFNQSAGKTAFITSLYVVFVPCIGLFFGRRTSFPVFLGVLGAVAGAFVLAFDFSGGESIGLSTGDLLVLACAVMFALQIMAIDRYSPKGDGIRLSLVQFSVVSVVSLPLSLIFEGASTTGADLVSALPSLLFLGIGSSGIAYTLQIVAQRRAHPAVACSVMSLESVFGMLGGILFFGTMPSLQEGIGCAILFVAVLYTQLIATHEEEKEKRQKEEKI
ncbi:MAG: DMT family transporter [Clostridia bacterium]|nr:DMT family transporter [Clostridia bacterium]